MIRTGYGSESEVEDESSRVRLGQALGRGQLAAGQSAVKLQEVGPRLSLRLHKVEEGLCTGTVMYHQFGGGTWALTFVLALTFVSESWVLRVLRFEVGRSGLRGWGGNGWGGVPFLRVGERMSNVEKH